MAESNHPGKQWQQLEWQQLAYQLTQLATCLNSLPDQCERLTSFPEKEQLLAQVIKAQMGVGQIQQWMATAPWNNVQQTGLTDVSKSPN